MRPAVRSGSRGGRAGDLRRPGRRRGDPRLQLGRLHRPGHAGGVRGRDRDRGRLRRLRFERGSRGEAAGREFRLRRGGADVDLPAPADPGRGLPDRSTGRSCRTGRTSIRRCCGAPRPTIPATPTGWSISGAPTASATTSPRSKERLGEEAPVDSWALVFDPATAAKLAGCGITMLDTASEMVPLALAYLGLPPDSTEAEDLEKVAALFEAVRPYVRYFNAVQYNHGSRRGRGLRVGRLLRRRLHGRRPGRRGGGDRLFGAEGRGACSGSTCWRSRPTRRTRPGRMPSSTSCWARGDRRGDERGLLSQRQRPMRRRRSWGSGDPRRPRRVYPTPEVMARLFPQPVRRSARRAGADPALEPGADRAVAAVQENLAVFTLGERRIALVVLFQVE